MEKHLVGYRFLPTGEELINHYLKNKNLGRSWLVDDAINEINIYAYEPALLPSLSKIPSSDPVWYFFSRKEYTSAKNKLMKRKAPSGFWKSTGEDRKIKDRRGKGVEIGIKKTLTYHEGKAPKDRTPWVIHEYHITSLEVPLDQRTYVICQVMYNGDDGGNPYGNNNPEAQPQIPYVDYGWTGSNRGYLEDIFLSPDVTMHENHHSMVSDSNTFRAINTAPEVEQPVQEDIYGLYVDDFLNAMNEPEDPSLFNPDTILSNNYTYLQSQTPCDNEFMRELLSFNGGNSDDVFPNPEIIMQEHNNDHRPKKPLSGFIVDCSSESESESIIATSYRGTSSPGDSDGSPGRHFYTSVDESLSSRKDSCTAIKTSAETFINRKSRQSHSTRRTRPSKQEVKEGKSKAVDASMDKKSSSSSSSMVKIEKKGWFITEEAMQRNSKNPPYIYLMNMFIGFILLVAIIGNIISALRSFKT